MGKMKYARCVECHKPIGRHDGGRVTKRVAEGSNGQGVYKDTCLACSQK